MYFYSELLHLLLNRGKPYRRNINRWLLFFPRFSCYICVFLYFYRFILVHMLYFFNCKFEFNIPNLLNQNRKRSFLKYMLKTMQLVLMNTGIFSHATERKSNRSQFFQRTIINHKISFKNLLNLQFQFCLLMQTHKLYTIYRITPFFCELNCLNFIITLII